MSKPIEMWAALAAYQPYADRRGFGSQWAKMCTEKTQATALNAVSAADAVVSRYAKARWSSFEVFASDAEVSSSWNSSWAARAAVRSLGREDGWMFDFAITRINSAIEEEQQLQAQADENATSRALAPLP
jgi:hypothetical protein